MGKLLQSFEHFGLWKIERQDLAEFTKFVLRVNYEHHLQTQVPLDEIEMRIKEDERHFSDTHFYVLKTVCGQIFGTINACLWNGKDELAFEREYNLNLKTLINTLGLNPPQIWHIGRFAIDRKFVNQNETLGTFQKIYFKLLMTSVLVHVCTHSDNLMIAECDRKLQKILVKLGIVSQELSNGHMIMGSETLPILNTGAGVRPFVEKHKQLLSYV